MCVVCCDWVDVVRPVSHFGRTTFWISAEQQVLFYAHALLEDGDILKKNIDTYLKEQCKAHPLVVGVVLFRLLIVEIVRDTGLCHVDANLKQQTENESVTLCTTKGGGVLLHTYMY